MPPATIVVDTFADLYADDGLPCLHEAIDPATCPGGTPTRHFKPDLKELATRYRG